MTDTYKVLGQAKPAAATLTPLYPVPAATQTTCSTITVCNQGASTSFRLSVAIAGAVDALTQYVFYDAPLGANETKGFTMGLTVGATDVIRCQSLSGNVSFSAFGVEVS